MSGRIWSVEARLAIRKLYFFGPVNPTNIQVVQRPERVDLRLRQLTFFEVTPEKMEKWLAEIRGPREEAA
jgi:hypothetical protein